MSAWPEFPRALLREKSNSWNLASTAASSGITDSSVMTMVRSDGGGFWTCSMTDISMSGIKGVALAGRDRQSLSTRLWRAVRNLANGGVQPIVVPRNDALFIPWPIGRSRTTAAPIPHDDGSLFDDGSGYYQPVIDVTAKGASLRATSLDLTLNVCGALVGGEAFSILHLDRDIGWRMYEIATVDYSDATHATITFNPPLRDLIEDDTALEFDRPRCLMRLAKPGSMDLAVAPWTFNSASVDFVEAFPQS
jgi:hypothetical protein